MTSNVKECNKINSKQLQEKKKQNKKKEKKNENTFRRGNRSKRELPIKLYPPKLNHLYNKLDQTLKIL